MKVLLINPFLEVLADDPAGINPALGLAYLSAYLEQKGVRVVVLDIAAEGAGRVKRVGKKLRFGLRKQEIKRRLKKYSPQIVGISCQSTLHAKEAHETAKIVKEVDKGILIVMGGAHPSSVPEEVLKDKNVDMVVRGEGEVTLWKIVKNYRQGRLLKGILGTSIRKEKKLIHYPSRPFIKDLDHLHFPARHLLPMEIYFQQASKGPSYNRRDRVMTMVTSRGCPGNCVYCAVKSVWGRLWRGRSPKNVVGEIETLIKEYQANEIHFIDDSISVDKKRLMGICDEIIKRRLNIKWTTPNGIAVWLMDKKLLVKMKQAGCYRLTFGLESGSKEILHQYIGKHYDFKKAKKIIKFCSKIGLWTVGTFIIGFPYETREQIEETINFAISTDLDFAVFYIANPFPGTRMYEDFIKEELLTKREAYRIVRGCRTKHFSHGELVELQAEAFSRFLRSRLKKPWRFVNKIKSFEDLLYTFKLGRSLLGTLANQALIKKKGIAALWE